MKIFYNLEEISQPFWNAFVTIGNFDGVHLGHQLLFSEVVSKAHANRGTAVAITFHPHPLQVVCPEAGIKLISTLEQKIELIEMAGINALLILPFTRELASLPAQRFVEDVLVAAIGVRELVVGYDYAFGKGREGDIAFLRRMGKKCGFAVTVVDAHYEEGMLASSTKVRELVRQGRMRDVRTLLGRSYQIRGQVQEGRKRGGTVVGFPTANLHFHQDDLCPRHGVYVVQVSYDGRCFGGVLNIGFNPTFDGDRLVAETHIFDFNKDIYGQQIKVNLLRFLRDEMKFSGPDELAAQIRRDVLHAREILEEHQQEMLLACEEKYNR